MRLGLQILIFMADGLQIRLNANSLNVPSEQDFILEKSFKTSAPSAPDGNWLISR